MTKNDSLERRQKILDIGVKAIGLLLSERAAIIEQLYRGHESIKYSNS